MSSEIKHPAYWYYDDRLAKLCAGVSICVVIYIVGSGWLWS